MQFSPFSAGAINPVGMVEYAKKHLRITGTDEDALLAIYASAAMEYVRHFTRTDWPTDPGEVPPEFMAAALLVIGDLYENREAQSPVVLSPNKTVDRLLWPLRQF